MFKIKCLLNSIKFIKGLIEFIKNLIVRKIDFASGWPGLDFLFFLSNFFNSSFNIGLAMDWMFFLSFYGIILFLWP
jgi:hypothetical protein